LEVKPQKEPLVSVIIPLYNAEKYIEETMESVISQTYQNWELIVVDDCSTDSSRNIVKEFEKKDYRIKLIELETNFGGPARPRNIGIDNAKGEYIAFLDADDVWLEEKLEIQLGFMVKNGLDFSSTNTVNIDKNSNTIRNKYRLVRFLTKFARKSNLCDFIKVSFIATSSVVVKKEIISNFNENKDFISVEDLCLWLKLFNQTSIKYRYLANQLLKYRVLEESVSERTVAHKQSTKADLCILTFILRNNRFDMIKCYYFNVFKKAFVNFIKNFRLNN